MEQNVANEELFLKVVSALDELRPFLHEDGGDSRDCGYYSRKGSENSVCWSLRFVFDEQHDLSRMVLKMP